MWVVLITVIVAVAGPGARTAAAAACPSQPIRQEQGSSALPDCRAYEMVTPPDKGSGNPSPAYLGELAEGHETGPLHPSLLDPTEGARAGVGGDRMSWVSPPLPGAQAPGISHLATRGPAGWASEDLVPRMTLFNGLICPSLLGVSAWSTDLSRAVLDLPAGPPAVDPSNPANRFTGEDECGHDEPRLVPGEPEHFRNLFLHDNDNGSNLLVNVTPPGTVWPTPEETSQRLWPASFLAGSADLSHVVFEEELALTPDAPIGYRGGDELYEWSAGAVRLVTVLPDGTPVHGSLAGATRNYALESEPAQNSNLNIAQARHAVSVDGARIFFEAEGALYVREDGSRTVQVDESKGAGPSGGGRFMLASADGSRVFFTDESQLTADSTAAPGEPDLYEYSLGSGQPDRLVDLTVNTGEAAGVLGVSGGSEDGSYVYFVARGALATAPNSSGAEPAPGEANLYLSHDGSIAFIATLDQVGDECDWSENTECGGGDVSSGSTSRVSGNGTYIAFNSVRNLTGYDNTDANTAEPDLEIYRYEAASNLLSCASCRPDGAQPTAGAAIHWPSNPGKNNNWANAYPQHNVTERGQVFFETAEGLSPRDVNGVRDVYEFTAGPPRLISTGVSEAGSYFLDATPSGSDVFFATAQPLVGWDHDSIDDYYDARIDGGFPEPPPSPPPCSGASCRGPGAGGPGAPNAGTSEFRGPGNPAAGCERFSQRSTSVNKRAKALRRRAGNAPRAKAKRLRKQSSRLAHQARTLRKKAASCRSGNGKASR
jgi:hypothetical protein